MWLDELKFTAQGGSGGDGAVHFARRKFEPFAGPDGGDGGKGGDVVFVGKRDVDSLYQFRNITTKAGDGAPGGSNLMIGANAPDYELPVPLGTIVYHGHAGFEHGVITASGERLVVAKGGKGGKGNPHYATGRRRTPKMFEKGWAGECQELLLRYRIYCDTALIEPSGMAIESSALDWLLLPCLLRRIPRDVDYDLYRRRPRWVRYDTDYNKYDCAYLPVIVNADAQTIDGHLEHAYWAQALIVNLTALPVDDAGVWWQIVFAKLAELPWRRLNACTVLFPKAFGDVAGLGHLGDAAVAHIRMAGAGELLNALQPLMQGGVIA